MTFSVFPNNREDKKIRDNNLKDLFINGIIYFKVVCNDLFSNLTPTILRKEDKHSIESPQDGNIKKAENEKKNKSPIDNNSKLANENDDKTTKNVEKGTESFNTLKYIKINKSSSTDSDYNKQKANKYTKGNKTEKLRYDRTKTMDDLFAITLIFQKQLPKMPKEYILRQVFDPKHKNLMLLSDQTILGGICYRPFYDRSFAEVVFCAIDSNVQVKGYGGFMMDFFKEHVKNEIYFYYGNKDGGVIKEVKNKEIDRNKTYKIRDEDTKTEKFSKKAIDKDEINANNDQEDANCEKESHKRDDEPGRETNKPIDLDIKPNNSGLIENKNITKVRRLKERPNIKKACKLLGLTTPTYNNIPQYYTNPTYVPRQLPVYLMTYADNFAVGYFRKNGFSTDIKFSSWIGCIKDYDGGTMMQCKIIWQVNYLNKNEFLEKCKTELVNKIALKSTFNKVWPGLKPEDLISKPVEKASKGSKFPGYADYKYGHQHDFTKFIVKPEDLKKMEKVNGKQGYDQKYSTLFDVPGLKEAMLTEDMLTKRDRREHLKDILRYLISDLQANTSAWPFLEPVRQSEVPDYYTIIKNPMDLSRMEKKIENGGYANIREFNDDFALIIRNCCMYNAPITQYYKCAKNLEEYYMNKMEFFKFVD